MEASNNGNRPLEQRSRRPAAAAAKFTNFNQPPPKIEHSRKKGRKVAKSRSKNQNSSKTPNLKTLPTTGTNTTPIKIPSRAQKLQRDCHSVLSSTSSEDLNLSIAAQNLSRYSKKGSFNLEVNAQVGENDNNGRSGLKRTEQRSAKKLAFESSTDKQKRRALPIYKPELDESAQADFSLFLRYESMKEPSIFELSELFNKLNRHFLPKVHDPDRSRELLEAEYPIPACYRKLVDTFTNLELTLFKMQHRGDKLTYSGIRAYMFQQTRL